MNVFENEIDFLVVRKVAEEATNILVFQVRLHLDLTSQCVRHVMISQLSLVHDFESDKEFTFLLAGEVHVTELAPGQRPSDLKVSRTPGARIELCSKRLVILRLV